ncbi:hypothetical protein MMC26_000996 [Xylographa opegraphella]|nr:hypothetical protein [Xylographa opegraphella]
MFFCIRLYSFGCLLALLHVQITHTTSVLFPAYIYPSSSSSTNAWAPLYSSLALNPTLRHEVIINPASGPGGPPNSDYSSAMQTLKTYPNAIPLGYVDTNFGLYNASNIEANISTWARWPSAVRPTGIFFDDVDTGNTAGSTAIMTQVAAYARSAGFTSKIVFNPGAIPVASAQKALFGAADHVIVYENSYTSYPAQAAAIKSLKNSGVPGRNMSVMAYGMPSTGTALAMLVANLTGECYGSVYLTDNAGDYANFGADWAAFTQLTNGYI